MVTIFYTHVDRISTEYSKEFEDVKEAKNYYYKMKNIKDKSGRRMYIVSYICGSTYEVNVMERIYK